MYAALNSYDALSFCRRDKHGDDNAHEDNDPSENNNNDNNNHNDNNDNNVNKKAIVMLPILTKGSP